MAKQFICTACGCVGKRKRVTKGNLLIEIFLWCFFLLPGFIYSIWRLTAKYDICPKCLNSTMIPLDSPMGQRLKKDISGE